MMKSPQHELSLILDKETAIQVDFGDFFVKYSGRDKKALDEKRRT